MKLGLFILGLFISVLSFGQGLEPSQIQGAPKLNDILQAKNMYIDEYGDTLYIYQHTSISGLRNDSIYLRNDTIYLRDGSGFVKIPTVGGSSLTAGQTVTVQTLITAGDTIYAEVNTNSLDSTHIKAASVARNDLSFTIDDSKWTQSGTNLYPKDINSNIGIKNVMPSFALDVIGQINSTQSNSGFSFISRNINSSTPNDSWRFGKSWLGNYDNVLGFAYGNNSLKAYLDVDGSFTAFNGFYFNLLSNTTVNAVRPLQHGNSGIVFSAPSGGGYTNNNINIQGWYNANVTGGNEVRLWAGPLDNPRITIKVDGKVGINTTAPNYQLDVTGDLRVTNRTGSAVIGAGFDSNGKLVQYSLDTAITIPETIINSGTNISVTGEGTSIDPYVINNTFNQIYQTISSNGNAGNITLSNGGGTLNLNINDADASATNEISKLGVSANLTGGAKLMNYTQGFSNGVGTNLVITGASASNSLSSDGGSITWTLPDASDSNELQNLNWNPTTRALGISSGTGVTLSDWMLKYDGVATSNFNSVVNNGVWRWTGATNGPNGTNHTTLFHAMTDANAYGWQLASTDAADDMYYRNNNGSSFSSWYRIASRAWASSTFLTSELDGSPTNELNTSFVKSGNTITVADLGASRSVNISQSVAPSIGQVLKWDGAQWNADTDNNTGLVYTGSTGINVTGTVITNTGDVSNINEVDVVRVSSALTGGGRIQNATNGSNQGSEIGLVITGATSSVTTGINGQITWTLPTDQVGITSLGGQTASSQSFSFGNVGTYPSWNSASGVHTFRLPSASSQQVLKFDGFGWTAGTDNNTTYTGGTGISISGGNVISNTGVITESDPTVGSHIKAITTTDISNWNTDLVGPTYTAGTGITLPSNAITLTNTGVTAASYTNATITVNSQGRITTASNGSSGLQNLTWTPSTNNLEISSGNSQTLTSFGQPITVGTTSGHGKISLFNGTAGSTGYLELTLPNGNRQGYIGFSTNRLTYDAEGGLNHSFEGGGVIVSNRSGTATALTGFTSGGQLVSAGIKTINSQSIIGSGDIPLTNIYNTSASTTSNRTVTTGNNQFEIRTSGTGLTRATNRRYMVMDGGSVGAGGLFFSGGTNSSIDLFDTGVRIMANGSYGNVGQVLQSNGSSTSAQWVTPSQTFDGIIARGAQSFTSLANNAALPIFGGSMTTNASTSTVNNSTTWTKGLGTGHYDITIVVRVTSPSDFVTLALLHGDTQVADYSVYNGEAGVDHSINFVTSFNAISNTCQIINTSGVTISGTIRSVSIKRVL